MGCDIHMWAEIRNSGQWEPVGRVFKNPYWRGEEDQEVEYTLEKDGENYYHGPLTDQPWMQRNYHLFSILADVRNGRGFAGVKTGEGFEPIAAPRGVPIDATDAYKAQVEYWGVDGHSHSWFTLRELLEFNWAAKTTTLCGIFSESEYIKALRTGQRESYSGGISGRGVEIVSPDEWQATFGDDFGYGQTREPGRRYFIRDSWQQTYAECAQEFLDETLPALASQGDPDNVRVVFFFDN